jgi:hypothetical protein
MRRPLLPCLPGLFAKAAGRPVRHLAGLSSLCRALHAPPLTLPDRATKALGNAVGVDEKADDLASISDPEDRSGRGARDIDGGKHTPIQEEATPCAVGICEIAYDLPVSIDSGGFGPRGAREIDIDLREHALIQEKAVDYTPSITEPAHDLAARIDPNGCGKHGAWKLNWDEGPRGGGAWPSVGAGGGLGGNRYRCGDHEDERARSYHKRAAEHSAKVLAHPVHGVSSS